MAISDGKLSDEEAQFLAHRAVKWGFTPGQVEAQLNRLKRGEIKPSVPTDKVSQTETLRELIQMMVIDGEIAPIERAFCAAWAMKADITPSEFETIIRSAL